MVCAKPPKEKEKEKMHMFLVSPSPEPRRPKVKVTQVKIKDLATGLRHWGDSVGNHQRQTFSPDICVLRYLLPA